MVRGLEDKIVNSVIYFILTLAGIVTVFPILYVVSMSLTPMTEVLKNGGYVVIPRNISFEAYRQLLGNSFIPKAFLVTVFITVAGTLVNMILTVLMAYPLSRKSLPFRSSILLFIAFTLLFSGGLIPMYLTVKTTGLLNSVWAMIIPGAIGPFYVLIMKSFFEQLPEEIFESARMDGAKELRVLIQIVLPLSLPSLLTISLFYIVGHWNSFFSAIMYITDRDLYPIQVIVRNILMQSQNVTENADVPIPTEAAQMAAVVIASLPVIVIYPFIQKYFAQGMMIGSIKG